LAWFAVSTHPQAERWARSNLERAGYRVYLPLYAALRRDPVMRTMSRRCELPLFPGYLFVALGEGDRWTPIRYCAGVADILGHDGVRPHPVPAGAVEALQGGEEARRAIAPVGTSWAAGDPCQLERGALAGKPAVVLRLARGIAVIGVVLFGQLTEATVPLASLARRTIDAV
jgi:transcription antitermination factor NusG